MLLTNFYILVPILKCRNTSSQFRFFDSALNTAEFLLACKTIRGILSVHFDLLLLNDYLLVYLLVSGGWLRQMTYAEVHIDAWFGELKLIDQVGCIEEPTLLLDQLLGFRLIVQALFELLELVLESLGVWEHLKGPLVVF